MPIAQRRPITVSIVSHGQQELIVTLLEQLERWCTTSIDKVILTINVPEANVVAEIDRSFPLQRVVNPEPMGFGANHNAAFQHCESEWFLVLNPDIRLDCDVLRTLLASARQDTGVLAPRIMEPGSSHAGPEPHRALLTPWEILSRNRPGYHPPSKPAWVPGMFMLLRTSVYRQVGGFDARFFMYGEDFDLCARLALSAWNIQAVESLYVTHDARRASRRRWRHLGWHVASLLRLWGSGAFWRYRKLWTANVASLSGDSSLPLQMPKQRHDHHP